MRRYFLLLVLMAGSTVALAGGESHGDPFAIVFESFAIILSVALLGRYLINKLKQSVVLGELLIGIALGSVLVAFDRPTVHLVRNQEVAASVIEKIESGNLSIEKAVDETLAASSIPVTEKEKLKEILTSGQVSRFASLARYIQLFSTIGIALLLFMVGLEGSISDLLKVGGQGILIALLGIGVTLGLAYAALTFLLSSKADPRLALFGAAAICSTSVGITARVLKDMGKLSTQEAKVTMGAAVFDDIFGLIILAILAAVMGQTTAESVSIGSILIKIVLFLILVLVFGQLVLPRITPYVERLDPKSARLLFPFILLLVFCYLANAFGLAMIIGAYFAGLMIKDNMFTAASEGEHHDTIHSMISPIEGIFVPVFFVLMGIQVDVSLFADGEVLLLGFVLSAIAVAGKIGAGIFLPKDMNRLAVGWGMVPRGEVVLIFASIGKALGIMNDQFYAVIVMVILITVLVTPIALKMTFNRNVVSTAK